MTAMNAMLSSPHLRPTAQRIRLLAVVHRIPPRINRMRNSRRVQQLPLLAVPRQQRRQLPKRSAPPARLQPWLALITISRLQHRAQPGQSRFLSHRRLPSSDKRNPTLPELIANRQCMASPVPASVICNPLQILWLQSPAIDPFLQNLRLLQV